MRIGFIADTHANIDYLVSAAERLLGSLKAERIFFLGGEYTDLDDLFAFKKKLDRGTEEYRDEHFLADIGDFLAGEDPGDDYSKKFVRVPEPGSPAYSNDKIPNKQIEMVGNYIVLLTHTPADVNRDDLLNASIIFHGALNKHQAIQKGNHYFICPGHLRDKEYEGAPATFGMFELENREARITFHTVAGDVLDEVSLKLTKKGKITVQG